LRGYFVLDPGSFNSWESLGQQNTGVTTLPTEAKRHIMGKRKLGSLVEEVNRLKNILNIIPSDETASDAQFSLSTWTPPYNRAHPTR